MAYCLRSACRAGDSRSRPQARSGGAERASLEGLALVRPACLKQTELSFSLTIPILRNRANVQSTPPPGMTVPEMWRRHAVRVQSARARA